MHISGFLTAVVAARMRHIRKPALRGFTKEPSASGGGGVAVVDRALRSTLGLWDRAAKRHRAWGKRVLMRHQATRPERRGSPSQSQDCSAALKQRAAITETARYFH